MTGEGKQGRGKEEVVALRDRDRRRRTPRLISQTRLALSRRPDEDYTRSSWCRGAEYRRSQYAPALHARLSDRSGHVAIRATKEEVEEDRRRRRRGKKREEIVREIDETLEDAGKTTLGGSHSLAIFQNFTRSAAKKEKENMADRHHDRCRCRVFASLPS